MSNSSAGSAIRNSVLCALATFVLAACGADGSSSSGTVAAAASDTFGSVVRPSSGQTEPGISTSTVLGNTATTPVASLPPAASTPPSTDTTVPSDNTATPNPGTPPVKNVTTGAATLDWMPPTQNADGSVLSNLAGYTVYYGTSPDNMSQSVKIKNPGLTAYTIDNLPSGTWYFAVTSYSSAGIESTRSQIVSTQI